MSAHPPAGGTGEPTRLRDRKWKRFPRGPDPALLEELYVPALRLAVRYDRCCAYYSSSVLAAAARGFAGLIDRLVTLGKDAPRPAVRLVVNEELDPADVRALTETGNTDKLAAALKQRFVEPEDLLMRQRLELLGWLVKEGLLAVRVGVMRRTNGIVHDKLGLVYDETGDALVFHGSSNESASGLTGNYEGLEVSGSWADEERYLNYSSEFEMLWSNTHPEVLTVTLPDALAQDLIKLAPEKRPVVEPKPSRQRQQAAMVWQYIAEAPYLADGAAVCDATAMVELWPHQRNVVEDTAAAWPDGRLLCDEVGMGKTIEAILILRRLMAGRGAKRILLLVPANLLKQWQDELREKGGLLVPRFESSVLIWPDERTEPIDGLAAALTRDLVLISRELVRLDDHRGLLLQATPWDLILLDEAHAARREDSVEGEYNSANLLLELVRTLQARGQARGFILMSATPMQTQPWEPWDLLAVLGEGGAWLSDFGLVRDYYAAVADIERGGRDPVKARLAAEIIVNDPLFPLAGELTGDRQRTRLERKLTFMTESDRLKIAQRLRHSSPLGRRMHRNTRNTLKQYFQMGLSTHEPRQREVFDHDYDYEQVAERELYSAITGYIERRFAELEEEKPGKGFVMTIYRRRMASSPKALELSLGRRRDGLARVAEGRAEAFYSSWKTEELDRRDLDDDTGERISSGLPETPAQAKREMLAVDGLLDRLRGLKGYDSKLGVFYRELKTLLDDGRSVLIFTEYVDTMEYLREHLVTFYEKNVGSYSGEGGCIWNGKEWARRSKDEIIKALTAGEIRMMVCTDAASEGLNLQAASAVINYDLPWNPSKVEQRIGRVDRIGQTRTVKVTNLFLRDSVDQKVYKVLKERCGLFRHFVGTMQPVLAKAKKMLMGKEPTDPNQLADASDQAAADTLAQETYQETLAVPLAPTVSPLTRAEMLAALRLLESDCGIAQRDRGNGLIELVLDGKRKWLFGTTLAALEDEPKAIPFTPLVDNVRQLADLLNRSGDRLPLIVATRQEGAFRAAVALWLDKSGACPVTSARQLLELVQAWDGAVPDPGTWHEAEQGAKETATARIREQAAQATEREAAARARQLEAAKLRLMRKLGQYLVCVDDGVTDFNKLFHQQMQRDFATADRLKAIYDRIGYPKEWPEWLQTEVRAFARGLTENRRLAQRTGAELDAALADPRWQTDLVRKSNE